MTKSRLGRGLDALIPTDIDEFVSDSLPTELKASENDITEVSVDSVLPNPHQPRTEFSKSDLEELSASIKVHGVLQPIVVIKKPDGNFQLVAGERRLRASKLAGLKKIPAITRTFNEQEQLELAVIENIQRADLKPLEVAIAYTKLIDQFNMTHEQIAKRVGKGPSTISNSVRLVNLPHPAKIALQKGQITEGHARSILSLSDPTQQIQLLELIISGKMNVREAEVAARRFKDGSAYKKPTQAREIRAEYTALNNNLGKQLGTKTTIQKTAKGGRIIIEFYSDEELDRISSQILSGN